jgi:ubiquinone/menaquinone biosynthesis C-methylase UbiE
MRRAKEEFDDELAGGFLKFFRTKLDASGQIALDLGCGFGGRTVQFARQLGCHTVGLEINEQMAGPAQRFAKSMGSTDVCFIAGWGESIPLLPNSVDLVLCYDVLEHVQDPEQCLIECSRVLKPGGLLLLVFPPYFHPTGAHLEGYVSRVPYTHLFFPSSVLLDAIDEILKERGDGYRPQPLRPHDKLYSLNGLTIKRFTRMLQTSQFETVSLEMLPLFSKFNRQYTAWKMRYYAWIFQILPRIPRLRECFTHRIVAVLRKS